MHGVLIAVTAELETALVQTLESQRDIEIVCRCADLPELLALAGTGRAVAAFVSADLRQLDRTALAQLRAEGLGVIGVTAEVGSEDQHRRLAALGVTDVVGADSAAELVLQTMLTALDGVEGPDARSASTWAANAGSATGSPVSSGADPLRPSEHRSNPAGRLLAVWGPAGAPGRTTVAVGLAAELADAGASTLLADADSYSGAVAQSLGILDEAPGLAAACRASSNGTLDLRALSRLAPTVAPNLRVLTGISRADRWPELPGTSLEQVWHLSRSLCEWTVIDTGFCLEQDEELSYDSYAPRRNAATLVSLEQADLVLVVGSADPVGLQRVIRGLSELRELLPSVTPLVVITRVRASAVGADPARRVRESLQRYAGVLAPVLIVDDRETADAAMLAGRSVVEYAPRSVLRQEITELAGRVRTEVGQLAP